MPRTSAAGDTTTRVDIGDAIRPFHDDAAGDQLTVQLQDHVVIAAEVLPAARPGTGEGATSLDAARQDHGARE
jgi:hypothetical protein